MVRVVCSAAAALIGAALLIQELAFTRLFGYLYPPNRVILILGLGAFGLAAGALVAHRFGWHQDRRLGLAATGAALAGALTVALTVASTTAFFVSLGIAEILLSFLVSFGAGMALAALYGVTPRSAGVIAGAQLLAGGIAALAAPSLLGWLSPATTALLSALLEGMAALICGIASVAQRRTVRPVTDSDLDDPGGGRIVRVLGIAITALFALFAVAAPALQFATAWSQADPNRIVSPKSLFISVGVGPQSEAVVFQHWDGHSRTEVTEAPSTAAVKWVYQDGSFSGLMHRTGAGEGAPEPARQDIGNVPFLVSGAKERVLVIGAGGGQEVLLALSSGARDVVVAEPADGVVAASRALAGFNGGWVDRPGVRVVSQDGRTFLHASGEQFDVIYLTFASSGVALPGGAVTGADLLTIEAFGDYMDALRQDGRLVVRLRDEQELLRAFNTAFQTWTGRGAAPLEAIRRLVALNNEPAAERQGGEGAIALPLLTVRKSPYLQDEIRAMVNVLGQLPYPPLFLPHFEQESMEIFPPLAALAVEGAGPAAIEGSAPYDVRPVTDSRPFFFETFKGIPWFVFIAPLGAAALVGGLAWLCRRPVWDGVDTLAQADAEAASFLESEVPWRYAGFAALVGGAWGFTVPPLLHRLTPLHGYPALSGSVIYGGLLVGAGIGALLTSAFRPNGLRPVIGWAGLAGGVLAIAGQLMLPLITGGLAGQGDVARLGTAALLLVPLGVCLGVPLPAAVRLLAGSGRGSWALLSVALLMLGDAMGRFLAFALGLTWGFTTPTVLGGICLFGVFLIAGLRALALPADELDALPVAVAPADHAAYQRPAES